MRMRYKPYARPELAAWPRYIDTPSEHKNRWAFLYARPSAPLYLELGCGKGGFLARQALLHPDRNFLGIDLKSEVLVVAKRTIEQAFAAEGRQPENIAILSQDIERIHEMFGPDDRVAQIYINFCNPWCKTGHAKHRLTHPRQLVQYRDFLVPGGEIWFKTDDDTLFRDSLRYFACAGFSIRWSAQDLHKENPDWNIPTEHEKMFSAEGIPIKACIACMQPATLDKNEIFRLKNI